MLGVKRPQRLVMQLEYGVRKPSFSVKSLNRNVKKSAGCVNNSVNRPVQPM